MDRLRSIFANPHTTSAGFVVLLIWILELWLPQEYELRLHKTAELVLAYAVVMAADGDPVKRLINLRSIEVNRSSVESETTTLVQNK